MTEEKGKKSGESPDYFGDINQDSPPEGADNASNEEISTLEEENSRLKDQIKEERFGWIFLLVLVIDSYLFTKMNNWGAPTCLTIMQLIGLILVSDRCGVKSLTTITDKILGAVSKK